MKMGLTAKYPSLEDKVVLVTGGASGIGADYTRSFAAQGARIAFIDKDEAAGQRLLDDLPADTRHRPVFLPCDVTDIASLQSRIREIEASLGAISVLVNNAASDQRHDLDAVTPEYWDDRFAVNVRHQFFAAQAVRPAMAAAGGGSIINMGSCSWRLGLGGMPAYLSAKAAVEGLTRALATEFGPQRIRVNCIVPGFVKIERTIRDFLTPEFEADILSRQRLPDLVEGIHVAAMGLFLASDDSERCTNQVYVVDGGWL
jgi:NAD(P)-dependent dehydrogenase (short-subunit alcohol dehydrogenase family)